MPNPKNEWEFDCLAHAKFITFCALSEAKGMTITMNLNNFENYIEKKILARGYDYYENNYVTSVWNCQIWFSR